MGAASKIEWTWTRVPVAALTMSQLQDAFDIGAVLLAGESAVLVPGFTFNPWIGCTKVSPGCAKCYAAAQDAFRKWTPEGWGAGKPRRRTSASNWNQVIKWDALAKRLGVRMRVFCASLADWLDDEVPVDWLADLLELIRKTPNLDWLLLTKRPKNWRGRIIEAAALATMSLRDELRSWLLAWVNSGIAPANIWIGTTVEDQERANERVPIILEIPACVRFLSCEPMLEVINLRGGTYGPDWLEGWDVRPVGQYSFSGECVGQDPEQYKTENIDWVIVGGESGPDSREFNVEAAWDLVLQCKAAGVATFVKQLGARPRTGNINAMDWPDDTQVVAYANDPTAAGGFVKLRDRKGGDIAEWPSELRIREYPEVAT